MDKEGLCVVKWKDKRDVLLISSEFDGEIITISNRRGQIVKKLRIVEEYNKNGVDRADQMLAYYPIDRRTSPWYVRLALHIFQIILNNSHN
jgi:hypothetical protein